MGKSVSSKYGHVKKGPAEDIGDGKSYSSGWERDVARVLQYWQEKGIIEGWEYEPQRFSFQGMGYKVGSMSYLPDFAVRFPAGKSVTMLSETIGANGVPKTVWLEVKGREMSSDRTKWRRFQKATGYDLFVVRREHILELREKYGDLVPWESWGTR